MIDQIIAVALIAVIPVLAIGGALGVEAMCRQGGAMQDPVELRQPARHTVEGALCPSVRAKGGFHCQGWFNGGPCCYCKAPAASESERIALGID